MVCKFIVNLIYYVSLSLDNELYSVAEVLELAGNKCKDNKRTSIQPRHIMMGIRGDDELSILCQNIIIPHAGVLPNVHPIFMTGKKRKAKKKKETPRDSGEDEY